MHRPARLLAPLLLLLPLAVLAPPAAAQTAGPTPAPAAGSSPSPGPSSQATPGPAPAATATVTLADSGTTVRLRPGQTLDVRLDAPSGGAWQGNEGLETGTPTLQLLALSSSRDRELRATLQALSAGRYGGDSTVRPQRLAAQEAFPCGAAPTACPQVGRTWSVDVVVEDGPPVTTPLACRQVGRPTPSPLPGSAYLEADDDGRTVTVQRDGVVVLYLDGCAEPQALPPRATPPLFRESVQLDRSTGTVSAVFSPQGSGRSQVTAAYDARCLHRTDAAGNGECAIAQRAFSVSVEVEPVAPGPPCYGVELTGPARVAAGSPVTLVGRGTAGVRVEVLFRRRGAAEFVVRRAVVPDDQGRFSVTWTAVDDHRWYARTSSTCVSTAGLTQAAPVVTGPAVVRRGETVTLRVLAAQGVRTHVFFRGAGEPFRPRAVLTGPGTVRYVATSDQRYYALTGNVASTPGLTQVR